ncbi:hypothetical protein NEUTE1DRAFT_146237 [Neurospora tetrasperma FGSC 2508]|uniref:EH domain-containing protein n=1 Tax=Neurospora tetrasperma (strain FGSC 2508 / ATCC MYA-4615 / P0657) TaxID=510951 RepID=F8MM14_NEUT8|nr:uncharacterized protein NEUTE1DRAFT_146237 [Neurospora tetrasperma FGSC 2508]EGO57688.1 hypothetical protein NEUTE1DRAFT_146237 [Neurospora tetrasperma FGSC 2508]EGZ72043.1 increased rDNA silencing protein 4 [Neurospora tetrasperma FGSC 2509]
MSASVTSSDGRGPASPTSSPTGASTNPATTGLAAALKGATLAFQHQQRTAAKGSDTAVPRPHGGSRVPTPGTGSVSTSTSRTVCGSNGARLAATLAAREHSPPTTSKNEASRVVTSTPSSTSSVGSAGRTNRQELHSQATGGSSQQQQQHVEDRANDHAPSKRPAMRSRRPSLASLSSQAVDNSYSHPPTPATSKPSPEPKSVSWIAATLAASRSGSPSPSPSLSSANPQTHPVLSQQHARSGRTRSSSVATLNTPSPPALDSQHPDTASIPPTTSLVAMFDGKQAEAETANKKKKKKKPRPASKTQHHQTLTSPSPTPSEGLSIENQCGTGGVPSVASGKSKVALKPKPKPRRDISLSTVESIKSPTGAMGRDGESSNQEQGETRNRNGDVRDKPSREGGKVTVTGAKDIVFEGTSERKSQQKVPATPRTVQSKQGVEVPTDKRPSTPPVSQHAQIFETKIISPQPRRVVSTPRLESSPAVPKTYKTVTSPRPDNKPTIRKSSRVVSPSVDQSQTIQQSAETGLGDRHMSRNSTSSDETFVSASSSPSPRPQTPTKELERVRPRLDRANTSTSSRASRVSTPASVRSPASQTRPSPVLRPGTGLYSYSTGASPTPEMSLDSLTNAMIASNLASSRLTALTQTSLESPGLPPVPPPRRGHRHHHLPHPHLRHRTQSPPHARPLIPQRTADSLPVRTGPSRQTEHTQPASLLKTLRAPRSLSDDEDLRLQTHRHRKKHLGGKKHAHNEGARRRWRDEMTIRQRRRYEAVWASNRGLFLRPGFAFEHPENWQPLPPPDDSVGQVDLSRAREGPEADLVVNVVVRDIWSRSRLPVDELAEVWELVDRRKCGALDKQEFVVGMWLIDQRLRGRKIPTVVGEGVWESAMDRVLSVNVKAPKAHKGRTKGHLKGVF